MLTERGRIRFALFWTASVGCQLTCAKRIMERHRDGSSMGKRLAVMTWVGSTNKLSPRICYASPCNGTDKFGRPYRTLPQRRGRCMRLARPVRSAESHVRTSVVLGRFFLCRVIHDRENVAERCAPFGAMTGQAERAKQSFVREGDSLVAVQGKPPAHVRNAIGAAGRHGMEPRPDRCFTPRARSSPSLSLSPVHRSACRDSGFPAWSALRHLLPAPRKRRP